MKFKRLFKIGRALVFLTIAGVVVYEYANREWDGKTRYTTVYFGSSVEIRSFDPEIPGDGLILKLPDNLELTTLGGRGKWKVGVLMRAGGVKWAADSIAEALGITYTDIWNKLSLWDRLAWWFGTRKLVWKEVDLAKTTFVVRNRGVDGVDLYQLTPAWDVKAGDWFASSNIAKERLEAKVFNTTKIYGLGSVAARTIENMGIKVTEVGGEMAEISKCVVMGQKRSVAVKNLVKWFNCEWKEGDAITVLLGEDYRKRRDGL